MVFKWRDNHTDQFLTLYKEYDFLWDVTSPYYKNRLVRRNAYTKIVERMNIPGLTETDIQNKIKTIRTNYKFELNKLLEITKNNPKVSYVPHLFWFKKADEFLRDVTGVKSYAISEGDRPEDNISHTNVAEVEANSVVEQGVDIKVEDADVDDLLNASDSDAKHECVPSSPTIVNNNESLAHQSILNCTTKGPSPLPLPVAVIRPETPVFAEPDASPNIVPSSAPPPLLRPSPGRVGKRTLVRITQLEKQIKHLQKSLNQNDEDEFDLFGRSIALQLKRMPLERAFTCQENLQRVMMQERLRNA